MALHRVQQQVGSGQSPNAQSLDGSSPWLPSGLSGEYLMDLAGAERSGAQVDQRQPAIVEVAVWSLGAGADAALAEAVAM
jgi:hypothetical protein